MIAMVELSIGGTASFMSPRLISMLLSREIWSSQHPAADGRSVPTERLVTSSSTGPSVHDQMDMRVTVYRCHVPSVDHASYLSFTNRYASLPEHASYRGDIRPSAVCQLKRWRPQGTKLSAERAPVGCRKGWKITLLGGIYSVLNQMHRWREGVFKWLK